MIKIRMVDSVCYDNWHLHFNSQLIEILSLVSSEVQYRGVQDIGNNKDNVKRKKLYVIIGGGKWRIILRYLFSLINDLWQLIVTPCDEIIVYCFDSTLSIRFINGLNKVLKKRVIMFRHGSMEMLEFNSSGKGIFYRFENMIIRQFFLNQNLKIDNNVYLFVLGDVILKNLSVLLTEDKIKQFRTMDHPYDFGLTTFVKETKNTSKLNIGTVGVFNEYKGGYDLLQLARKLKSRGLCDLNVSVTGKIEFDISMLEDAGINLPSKSGKVMVSIQEMEDRIDSLDFILYFYHNDTYRLTASGAIFDAINRKRPIIALRNDYFEYIFNKFGSIGYLVDSLDEMEDLIYRIANGTEGRVNYDFDKIKNLLSTNNLAKIFANELKEVGFTHNILL